MCEDRPVKLNTTFDLSLIFIVSPILSSNLLTHLRVPIKFSQRAELNNGLNFNCVQCCIELKIQLPEVVPYPVAPGTT